MPAPEASSRLRNSGQVRLAELFQNCCEKKSESGVHCLEYDHFAQLLVFCSCEPDDVAEISPALAHKQVSEMIESMLRDEAAIARLEQ